MRRPPEHSLGIRVIEHAEEATDPRAVGPMRRRLIHRRRENEGASPTAGTPQPGASDAATSRSGNAEQSD